MSRLYQPLYLDNPGIRVRLIAEVWDQSALSAGFGNFDTNAMVFWSCLPQRVTPRCANGAIRCFVTATDLVYPRRSHWTLLAPVQLRG